VQVWPAELPTDPAVQLQIQKLSGTFPMEVQSQILLRAGSQQESYHTTVLDLLLEQYISTATLRVLQQETSAVTYLVPMELYRASMWGYTLAPLVSEGDCAHSVYITAAEYYT